MYETPLRWRSGRALASQEIGVLSSVWKTYCKSLNHVMKAPLSNASQQVCMSRVPGDDYYKELEGVTVGVAL